MTNGFAMVQKQHTRVESWQNHHTRMEADPVSLMLSWSIATIPWKAGSLYSNLFPYMIPDIMFEAAYETTLAFLKGSPEKKNKQKA